MFSSLARGVGTWTGDIHTHDNISPEDVLPVLPTDDEYHPHGITVSPHLYAATTKPEPAEKADGELILPKTFITRKGALMLFTAPEDFDKLSEGDRLYMRKARRLLKRHYQDEIAKLGKLSRLAQSILIFGDKNYPEEDASISDARNKVTLKFLHDLDVNHCDERSRPGSDPNTYLHDLQSRSRAQSSVSYSKGRQGRQSPSASSRETTTLSADSQSLISCLRPGSAGEDNGVLNSSRSGHRVLSADKLCSSIKSTSYLGRPSPTPVLLEGERAPYPHTPPVSRRSSAASITYRHTSTPLLEHRHKLKPNVDGNEPMSGHENVKRFLEDIQSEDIREESLADGEGTLCDLVAADIQIDKYADYVERELDSLEEQSDNDTLVETEPPPPTTTYSKDGQMFKVLSYADNYQTDSIVIENLAEEQVKSDLIENTYDVAHNLLEAPQAVQDLDDEDAVIGVTAVDIINSCRGSEKSSHSGFLTDDMCIDIDDYAPTLSRSRVQSARGQRVQSARGQRVHLDDSSREHSAEEEPYQDVTVDAPVTPPGTCLPSPTPPGTRVPSPMPPGTRVPSPIPPGIRVPSPTPPGTRVPSPIPPTTHVPLTSTIQYQAPESAEQSTAKTDTVNNDMDKTDMGKSGKHAVEQKSVKQLSISSANNSRVLTKTNSFDADVSAADKRTDKEDVDDNQRSDFVSSTSLLVAEEKSSKLYEEQVASGTSGVTASQHETRENTPGVNRSETVSVVPNEKVEDLSEAREPQNVSRASRIKGFAKDPSKEEKQTKASDVTRMATAKKSPPEKKEPLLQGLESYIMKPKKESNKKTDREEKKIKMARKNIPVAPLKSSEELVIDEMEKEDIYNQWERRSTCYYTVTEILGNRTTDTGYSAEELEIEQQLLEERLKTAEQKVKGESASPPSGRQSKGAKKAVNKKIKRGKETKDEKIKEDLAKRREALREARRLEKMKRLEEAKRLEEQIKEKEEAKKQAETESERKAQALREQIEMMAKEAAEARRLEEEAKQQMALERRKAREEREARRKADLERKKQEAAKHREHEKKMMEAAKLKEEEMLARITDAEHRCMIEEEERKKREEEELLEEQRKQEEEEELERLAEEEEAKLRELERQAEEQALAFLVREREEAEARQRALLEQAEWEEHQRELQRDNYTTDVKQIEEEKAKLEEQMRKQQEEEMRRFEEEKKRLEELQKIEQEHLERLRREMEEKRTAALRRREINMERRKHLNKLVRNQDVNRPWVFTYYVHWPRETYTKPMGQEPKKKGFRSSKKPKPKLQ